MLRRFLTVVLLSVLLVCPGVYAGGRDPAFDQIDSIIKTLSEITGLPQKHSVPYGTMSKEQLRRFLKQRIKKNIKPAEIHADELSLKMFGLVPQDFDLRESTINLLTEQAAAFYDYDAKKLFLLESASPEEEVTTLAHELAHALADQYFHLGKFIGDKSLNDDQNLARTAVVEGEASWLMLAYDLKQAGHSPAPDPALLKSIGESDAASISDYPVLKSSPLYIRRSLLFPYSEGTLFFDAVYRKMGKEAFSYVFTNPPSDTAQIIHPDRYFAHVQAVEPELPKLGLKHQKKEITGGDLGEFDHEILLEEYLGASVAKNLSRHLRGGDFVIVPAGKPHLPVLEYASEWDSHAHAALFFAAYKRILRKKWKHCDPTLSTANTFAGTGDDGLFVAHLSGNSVWSVEGLHNARDWTRLKCINQHGLQ